MHHAILPSAFALQLGFEPVRREMVRAHYMANQQAMLRTCYDCAFFTMRKPLAAS